MLVSALFPFYLFLRMTGGGVAKNRATICTVLNWALPVYRSSGTVEGTYL